MKAIPIIYEGIQFRSKLEARWYIFMKKLGWNVVYEPEIEGINGWIPDFLIIGKKHKILVDVKPIDRAEEWETHPDYNKILNSGIKNLPDYELLILGTNLQLDDNQSMGIFYIRDRKLVQKENRERVMCPSQIGCSTYCKHESFYNTQTLAGKNIFCPTDEKGNLLIELPNNILYEDGNCVFSCYDNQIGFMTHMMGWCCRITGEGGKTYIFRPYKNEHSSIFEKIDTCWNKAWTELRWKGKENK